jgi:hypothetical protein
MIIEANMVNDLFHSCHRYHQGFEGCQILKPAGFHKNLKPGDRTAKKSPHEICEKCAYGLFEIAGLHCLSCQKPVSRVPSSQGPTTWSNWPEHGWFYYKCDSCRVNCYSPSDLGK